MPCRKRPPQPPSSATRPKSAGAMLFRACCFVLSCPALPLSRIFPGNGISFIKFYGISSGLELCVPGKWIIMIRIYGDLGWIFVHRMFILCSLNILPFMDIIQIRNPGGSYLSQCRTRNIVFCFNYVSQCTASNIVL